MSATSRNSQKRRTVTLWLARAMLLSVVVSARSASAAQDYWSTEGPAGGEVRAVAVDPTDARILYVGTNGGGVFKSIDGAASWTPTGGHLGSGVVFAITVDPKTPATLYAVADGHEDGRGVFKSTDSGRSWSALQIGRGNVDALVLDPITPTTIYVGSEAQAVVKSTDGGATWHTADTDLTSPYIRSLAIDPTHPATLYAGTLDGVFTSTDGATTWHAVNNGIPAETVVHAAVIDASAPATVYIGTPNGVLKSTDAGSHWDPAVTGLDETYVVGLTIDPGTPGTLYATSSTTCEDCPGDVFRSTDGGAHWEAVIVGQLARLVHALAVTAPRTLFAGTFAAGVLTSTDGGSNWVPVNNGLTSANVRTVAIAATTPNSTIYAGVFGGIFKSPNGLLWIDANVGLTDINILAIAVAPSNPTTLYANVNSRVFTSTNGGDSWSDTGAVFDPIVFAVDPTIATTVYAGTSDEGLFKSTDGGPTWSHENVGLFPDSGVNALAVDPMTPATLYAGVGGYNSPANIFPIFKSTDAGISWTAASVGLDGGLVVTALAIDPLTATTIYAASYEGVFKSTDGAGTWRAANNGLATVAFVSSLAIDPFTPATLYAGTAAGVYKSTSGGAMWRPLNTGLGNLGVSALVVDPQGPSVLYAGTCANGVWTIAQLATCPGDCDHSGQVTVIELITGLNISLDVFPISSCASLDQSGDGSVSIDELIAAVGNALNGCRAGPN